MGQSARQLGSTLTVSDLLLNDEFFGGFGSWWWLSLLLKGLLLLLHKLTRLLLGLNLLLSLLLLARLVTELVTTRMLSLVPPSATNTRPAHHSDRHLDIAPILLVDGLCLLQSLNLQI